jgi:hypothetical protein
MPVEQIPSRQGIQDTQSMIEDTQQGNKQATEHGDKQDDQGDIQPQTQERLKLAMGLVVGNGFTIDCVRQLGGLTVDISRPLTWQMEVPGQPGLDLHEALPHFRDAVAGFRAANPDQSDFDVLRNVIGVAGKGNLEVEAETRHFLVMAYRHFSVSMYKGPLERWRWFHWIRDLKNCLLTAVSFNYDCLLEKVLQLSEVQFSRLHNVAQGITRVFKPHGSADFDLVGLVKGRLTYPLKIHALLNNNPFRVVVPGEWDSPPSEAVAVLPYECNPYQNYQWVAPGYKIYSALGAHMTHCVFVGLSYHTADRPEIDHFLYSTPKECRIVIASPAPPQDFVDAVTRSGRRLYLWPDGPQRLPLD